MKTTIGILIGLVIALLGFIAFSFLSPQTAQAPHSDTQTIGITDLITIESPQAGTKISSPIMLTGTARGTWYFEASFPIEVLDQNGNMIGQGYGEAQSDWMTEDFVPFKASVSFTPPAAGTPGIVRVKNDNPSGEPERDKHVDIPVVF